MGKNPEKNLQRAFEQTIDFNPGESLELVPINQNGALDEVYDAREAIRKLPKREREIIMGIASGETRKDLGKRYDLTNERIAQVEAEAIHKIRAHLGLIRTTFSSEEITLARVLSKTKSYGGDREKIAKFMSEIYRGETTYCRHDVVFMLSHSSYNGLERFMRQMTPELKSPESLEYTIKKHNRKAQTN